MKARTKSTNKNGSSLILSFLTSAASIGFATISPPFATFPPTVPFQESVMHLNCNENHDNGFRLTKTLTAKSLKARMFGWSCYERALRDIRGRSGRAATVEAGGARQPARAVVSGARGSHGAPRRDCYPRRVASKALGVGHIRRFRGCAEFCGQPPA